jgi:hypothetical protein
MNPKSNCDPWVDAPSITYDLKPQSRGKYAEELQNALAQNRLV